MTEKEVLTFLASSQRAWTAYEIAEGLAGKRFRVAPSQVYRALARLCARGQVRRIESQKAYAYGGGAGLLSLLCRKCRDCNAVDEEKFAARVVAKARQTGFDTERLVLEVWGLCARCGKQAAASVLLLLCALLPASSEALACPYHGIGNPQRFDPFDGKGGWRENWAGVERPSFDTGPTATQPPKPQTCRTTGERGQRCVSTSKEVT